MKTLNKEEALRVVRELADGTVAAEKYAYYNVQKALNAMPTTEVVECWDCGEYDRENAWCAFWDEYRDAKHFCGEAKRRRDA